MTEQEKKEKPRTAAVLARIAEIPADKLAEKRRSVRDGFMYLALALAGIAFTVKFLAPPPLTLIYVFVALGAFGVWNASNEMTRLEADKFFAKVLDWLDRILGRTPRAPQ